MPRHYTALPVLSIFEASTCAGCPIATFAGGHLAEIATKFKLGNVRFLGKGGKIRRSNVALVEGVAASAEEELRLHEIRRNSDVVVTIGACACKGGIPYGIHEPEEGSTDAETCAATRYPRPVTSVIQVDALVGGCPIVAEELQRVVAQTLRGVAHRALGGSVCVECKLDGRRCINKDESRDEICLGSITQRGCAALCIPHGGCKGCRNMNEGANVESFVRTVAAWKKVPEATVRHALRLFNNKI